jgi:hypothetical protein
MKRLLIALAIVAIFGYGLFEARRLIGGPIITIDSPQDGSTTSTQTVTIKGKALNIAFLTINDAPAYTDEQGNFSEELSPPPGYAIFTVAATDRFGRRASAEIHITVLNFCQNS